MINSLWHIINIAIGIAPNTTATTITVWLIVSYFAKKTVHRLKEKR